MSDELPSREWHQLTAHEWFLLQALSDKGHCSLDCLSSYVAATHWEDGGMGSFSVRRVEQTNLKAVGRDVRERAELAFTDADGVVVLAGLLTDESMQIIEVDVWKVDFSPTNRFPVEKSELFIPKKEKFGQ